MSHKHVQTYLSLPISAHRLMTVVKEDFSKTKRNNRMAAVKPNISPLIFIPVQFSLLDSSLAEVRRKGLGSEIVQILHIDVMEPVMRV